MIAEIQDKLKESIAEVKSRIKKIKGMK